MALCRTCSTTSNERAAFLVANRVAEQTAEQTNVVPQRTVWLVLEVHG